MNTRGIAGKLAETIVGTLLRNTLALIAVVLGLLAPAHPADAHEDGQTDTVESCSTAKRANGRQVTRVRWESGRQLRRTNLTARTRLFPGTREQWSSSWGKPDPRVVACTVVGGGTVLVRTKSRAKYAFIPPPPTAPANAAPKALARWQVPVTLSAPGLDASWQHAPAAAAWNAGLPDGMKIAVTDTPCAEGQPGCIPVRVEDLTGLTNAEVDPHAAWRGAAWPSFQGGVMHGCRIGLSPHVAIDERPHVMMHELGHCLGLPHWDTEGDQAWTVMSIRVSADAVTSWDLKWLSASYATR